MKKAKIVDIYKHKELVLDLDENARIVVMDGWFTKIITFHKSASVEHIESCLNALGFKKED